MTLRRVVLAVVAATASTTAAPGAAAPAAAGPLPVASGAPARGLSDGGLLASADPQLRVAGIAVAKRTGARFGRIPLGWSTVVTHRGLTRPPASVSLAEPSHPTYDWSRIDGSIRDLTAAGLEPIAYFMAPPRWAQSAPAYPYALGDVWAPRPADLADFASAAARRYDGSYPDPLHPGAVLPRVSHFQTWNEPNLGRYLQPQWLGDSQGRPILTSAAWYRRMHVAAEQAIRGRQPSAKVALAGLAPNGDAYDGGARVAPLRFLRALLCTDAPKACGPRLRFDAIALHPLSVGDPDSPAIAADDIGVADLEPKLDALLRRARRLGVVGKKRPELWITEINWTDRTLRSRTGIPRPQQAAVIGRAMARLAQAGATIVNWQFATDPSGDRTRGAERPAGLTRVSASAPPLPGEAKPFLRGFAFPVAAYPVGAHRAWVWSAVPVAEDGAGAGRKPPTAARIQVGGGGRWRTVLRARPRHGMVEALVAVHAGSLVRVKSGGRSSASVLVRDRLALGGHQPRASSTAPRSSEVKSPGRTPRQAGPLSVSARAAADALLPAGGPVAFAPLPPLLVGGPPPMVDGRPVFMTDGAVRPIAMLTFRGGSRGRSIIGTSGSDRLIGTRRHIFIGLGGDDRIDRRP